ncbi:MAG: 16S rRNA (guanine(527)-N(7))-methyltransferase RsmG [Alphaproteobacteria bacterium]|nr:16S rRNA (guanine(527)-N(7))-methyltransferase RsmG [Alphaproteobacteria bacterium]
MPARRPPLSAAAVARQLDVSRETLDRLSAHVALLGRWQRRINLVSNESLRDVWRRHVLDSAQLRRYRPRLDGLWLDLGSGAGFPGLVLAILGLGRVRLVESDQRKCAFLAEAARITGTEVEIVPRRIESLAPGPADVITARALAPLPKLLATAAPLVGAETELLLWKGQDVEIELTEAAKYWNMRIERLPSVTDPAGTILSLRELARV